MLWILSRSLFVRFGTSSLRGVRIGQSGFYWQGYRRKGTAQRKERRRHFHYIRSRRDLLPARRSFSWRQRVPSCHSLGHRRRRLRLLVSQRQTLRRLRLWKFRGIPLNEYLYTNQGV